MRGRFVVPILVLVAVMVFSFVSVAQTPQDATKLKASGPTPKRDLSGVWVFMLPPGLKYPRDGGAENPAEDFPPLTAWGQERYKTEKPGYGPDAAPGGNDPILQCDPVGFPRILFFPTPMEMAQIPGRVLQFYERDHQWREIWVDGRPLPKDPDPTWYGYAVGKWTDDYTLVVDTIGLDDRTWLGPFGVPHSDQLHVQERYHRVDHDTIEFNITLDDPVAFTQRWVGIPRILKLRPQFEIPQFFCVYSEEKAFADRIRTPAAAPRQNKQ